jgi:hypothetical protein
MSPLCPVSATLEADLRSWVRRHGIVLWLDLDAHYNGFIGRLAALRAAGSLPYDVHAFRGSHLELMLALEGLEGGVEKTPLVVHLPGFNEESVRETPLLELYAAGARYRKALSTLFTEAASGKAQPDAIASFQARGSFTLEEADEWLTALLDDGDWFTAQLRSLGPAALLDDLLGGGEVARRVSAGAGWARVWPHLEAWLGLPAGWREQALPVGPSGPEDVAFAAASWALSAEYVSDLKRPPEGARLQPVRGLAGPLVEACRGLAEHLRGRHPEFYRRTADETEASLTDEVEAARPEDLGKIDTFRFEENKVLRATLSTLESGGWDAALAWADAREQGGSFWLADDPARRSAWLLVADAARLGRAIGQAGNLPDRKASLERALDLYRSRGAAVDRAHRHLEQRRAALLYPPMPEFEALRARLDQMRERWREWADRWAWDFNAVCKEHSFLPPLALEQRTLFDEVVRPFTQEPGPTALFVVDALRYEMGEELYQALSDTPATTVQLRARLAELPTVTEVGMNVLAPVADRGRLRPALSEGTVLGFSAGEFRVSDFESRKRAMHDRVGGVTCPWLSLDEVLTRDQTSLKQAVARARLVVVHSDEIDRAGERGVGLAVFDQALQRLRAAWRLLREAGVRRFVFTADHGFLLIDEASRPAQAHGRKVDPKRRYVISPIAADHAGEVRVPLADLGYEAPDLHLMFPDSTSVFDTGRRPTNFVHGGNSLQERAIPVLTLSHRAAAGGSSMRYVVEAHALDGVAGMHCVEARVAPAAQQQLSFGGVSEVELGLRAQDAPGVQAELCQTRGGARLSSGAVVARVGESFELFFRLVGAEDARVLVEIVHPGAEVDVTSCVLDARFAVTPRDSRPVAPASAPAGSPAAGGWLERLPEGGVRQVFEHLAAHGAVTETEATAMLGGPRPFRRFALHFEEYAARAPFGVRIDVVGGVKRYVREGAP